MARPRLISDEQILCATRAAVLSHGPGVSLDQVASTLGVSGPALLKRFGSRDALILEALRPAGRPEWITVLLEGPGEGDFEAQLLELLTRFLEFMALVVPALSALRESGIAPNKIYPKERPPEVGLKAMQRWLAAAREKGLIRATETDTAAFAILGAVQSRAFFSHVMKLKFSAEADRKYLEELAGLFARALDPVAR